jgi:hypothetical protein
MWTCKQIQTFLKNILPPSSLLKIAKVCVFLIHIMSWNFVMLTKEIGANLRKNVDIAQLI